MASSSTLRTSHGTTTSVSTCPDDDKECVLSFGTLGLGKDFGFLRNQERREEIAKNFGQCQRKSLLQCKGTINEITERVPNFPQLMEDQHGHHLFQRHLEGSTGNELELIVNQVLYDQAIRRCCKIATEKTGCLSLNDCTGCISTSQRKDLLNDIVENADFLSEDPFGNYVVLHVLKLQNQELTDKICNKLRGHYTDLSSKKGGSHVVKKCMTSSIKGMKYAVEEFLENGRSLGQLARD
ncbi:hypothetical protein RJ640_003518 [Escallonia rubra]|uniref:PUM-HD domain-containing protein n=1 Tax=Escallonia rubra TaxID=112253 RepID=A0AA88UEZ6_9ASTE|nr:hypothetical protein RJ640_003518 [Escallonia rubra]